MGYFEKMKGDFGEKISVRLKCISRFMTLSRLQKKGIQFVRRAVIGVLLFMSIFGDLSGLVTPLAPQAAEAAQVSIDTTAQTSGTSHLHAGPQSVFISDQIGYKFYRDSGGGCVYSKTINGGSSWGAAVAVISGTDCIAISVWYDRWTPNDTGTKIHMASIDSATNNDNIFYNALDTSNDTLLVASSINTDPGNIQTYTLVLGANYPTITKATNGTIYVAINDASDSAVLRCSVTCGTGTNWTEVGTSPFTVANDYSLLLPLTGGDIMVINRVVASEIIQSKIWNNTSGTWSAAWTPIDTNATDNTTYDIGMAAIVASSTVAATTTTFFAYTADNATLGTDDDVRTARYQGGQWATSTTAIKTQNVLTNDTKGLTNVAIGLDQNTGNVYVAYTGQTTAGTAGTGNTYWKMSTTSMSSWTTEQGPINSAANDMYGVDLNGVSDQRMYATWFGVTGATVFGNTIADLIPGVVVATTSAAQTATVNASTTNFYTGGAFTVTENIGTRNVTNVQLTENGTVDAANALKNVKLFYKNDVTFPYDCATDTYTGTEAQFGSTVAGGFSGADGTVTFTGSVSVSTTSTLCLYPVVDVMDAAASESTLHLSIINASTSVAVSGGAAIEVRPIGNLDLVGSTTIKNDVLTQSRYHWRNDNGSETTATSKTASTENTPVTALFQGSPARLRMEIANNGTITSSSTRFQLEYGQLTTSCSAISSWTYVDAAPDAWDMYNSPNITDGNDTTNIAVATGGVTDDKASFVTPNAALKDTSARTAGITLSSTQFAEIEYSIIASTTVPTGTTYCFRVTDAGTPLPLYTQYPQATVTSDFVISATGTEATTKAIGTTTAYLGGAFVMREASSSRNITSISLAARGTVDASTGISNIKLLYDNDTTAPYDCASESYSGAETQFGSTATSFSAANGTTTFTGSLSVSTTSAKCFYVVFDTTSLAHDNETLNIVIDNAARDVIVSGGASLSPSTTVDIPATTTLRGAVFTQAHYHWRNDNGSEPGATSATYGAEDTPLSSLYQGTPIRLRVEVSNAGGTTSPSAKYRLDYGPKITTCSAVASWTDVGAALGAWDMYDSPNLTEGADTTDVPVATGGVTNANTSFLTPNAGVKDTSSLVASTTLSGTQFVELEYSIAQTSSAGYSSPYCFRMTRNGAALDTYSVYPELTTAPERDFKVQHGTSTISGTSITLVAGVDYVAPTASTSAFMRITNTGYTGAGSTAGGTQNAKDVTAYIQNPWNIMTSVTIARPATAVNNTRVSWEIVEFFGQTGSDNQVIVRQQQAVTYGTTATDVFATGTPITGVASSSKVVVFITGQLDPDSGTANYNTGQSTAEWNSTSSSAVFQRGEAGSDASIVSYAVIEFVGQNWKIQRLAHTYASAGVVETEPIAAVNNLGRTFLHTQKRMGVGLNATDQFGHEVWLSSVGQISLQLESTALSPSAQTSVVWVIENTQTSTGAMVVTRSNGSTNGGTSPLTLGIVIGATVSDVQNTSLFVNNRASLSTQVFPRPILGALISTSTTQYQFWRSDTGSNVTYRTEVVEWPVAGTSLRQNAYRLYVHNNALVPTDPWPPGVTDLGENTPLGVNDSPPGGTEQIRIRMSLAVVNSSLPGSSQSFKLQFGTRVTSCGAISSSNWLDLGNAASNTPWRGYDASGTTDGTPLSGNPPTGGDLKLTPSDIAGSLVEQNPSVVNPYSVAENQDLEYDWIVQQNNAAASTTYCFRMVKADGTALDAYLDWPQIRTAPFSPATRNWRWYDDEVSITPTVALAAENTSPINIANGNTVRLRVTTRETKNVTQTNARFKLQFSEYSTFSSTTDVAATTSCTGSSLWCYANGPGNDNGVISTKVLSDSDTCVAGVGNGCGTFVESTSSLLGYTHVQSAAPEYDFTVQSNGPRVNRTYFFRLFDTANGTAVPLDVGASYPSLTTEGATLVFGSSGLATSTVTQGVTTDIASTPSAITFGSLPPNTQLNAAQRFSINTNATEGYQMLVYSSSPFISAGGDVIPFINASNTAPVGWSTGCIATSSGCYGYHSSDATLSGGSNRFAAQDTYAAFEPTLREVAYSSIPVTGDTIDMVYRVLARGLQPAGQYVTDMVFVIVPAF